MIYDLKIDKAFNLNETSAFVWDLCDGETDVKEISRKLSAKFKKPCNKDLIWLAIEQLKRENLLESSKEIKLPFAGENRREVIKRIGLASMIALPLISSIAAPTAAHAASVCSCPAIVLTVCQNAGEQSIGCYPDFQSCDNAVNALNIPAYCCNGGTTGYAPVTLCCYVRCN